MIARPNDLRKVIKLRKNVFLCWLESFCGKYSNLIVNCLGNEISGLALTATETTKKVIASILEVEETIRNEIVQTCDS
jgi:hypothetical protein